MAEPKTVEVNLLGRSYRVACDDHEREALMQAVAYLDAKMNEIRKAGKVMGAERIAVMAALNVAHELLTVRLGSGFDLGQAAIEMFEGTRVAFRVATVAVKHVEIDKVAKDKTCGVGV